MSLREYVTVYHAGFRDEAIATLPPVVEPIASEIEPIAPPAHARFSEFFARISPVLDEAAATLPPVVAPISVEIEPIAPPAHAWLGVPYVRIPPILDGFEGTVPVAVTPITPVDLPPMWVLSGERVDPFPYESVGANILAPFFLVQIIVSIPAAEGIKGRMIHVKEVVGSSNTFIIRPDDGVHTVNQTIERLIEITINSADGGVLLMADGVSNWMIVARVGT